MEPSGVTTTPPNLVLSSGLPRVHCDTSSKSLKKMLNIFINLPPGYTASYWPLAGICVTVSSHSARFQSIWFAFGEAMMTSADFLVINVPRNGFQNQMLHYLLWNQGEVDQHVVSLVLPPPFLKIGVAFSFLQFPDTFRSHHDRWKIIKSGFAMVSARLLSTRGYIPSEPMDSGMPSSQKHSLTWSSSMKSTLSIFEPFPSSQDLWSLTLSIAPSQGCC